MLRVLIGIVVFAFSLAVHAEGNPARGQTLTVTCVACHGTDGNSAAGAFPSIAGQGAPYLVKQMLDLKEGRREAVLMTGLLDSMSEQDIRDMAAFYAEQEPAPGAASPDKVELGEKIYRAGIARKNVAACTACHMPNGQGNAAAKFPALAGQWPEYTEAQLKAFRSGVRHNDGETRMMRLNAMDLSDDEIAAVASYLRGLR